MNPRIFALCVALPLAACGGASPSGVPKQIDPVKVELPTRRIVIYGDSRAANPGEQFFMGRSDPVQERALIIERIANEKPDLILHSGDLVGRGSRDEQWDAWAVNHKPLFDAKIPFYAILGNHEYFGDSARGVANFYKRFPTLNGCRWYAVHAGPVLFAMLDTNFGELPPPFITAQDEWYLKTLKDAEADAGIKAVVTISHHPPYTNSKVHGPNEETRRRFSDPAVKFKKFKMYVAGHVHNYERFLISDIHYIVSGGGGAPQTGVRTEDFRTVPAFKGPEFRPFHYLLATLADDRMTLDTMMLQDDGTWKSGDRFEIPW